MTGAAGICRNASTHRGRRSGTQSKCRGHSSAAIRRLSTATLSRLTGVDRFDNIAAIPTPASSDAANYDTSTSYLDGFGGSINVTADGGLIRALQLAQMDASGYGQYGGANGGDAFGGSINISLV